MRKAGHGLLLAIFNDGDCRKDVTPQVRPRSRVLRQQPLPGDCTSWPVLLSDVIAQRTPTVCITLHYIRSMATVTNAFTSVAIDPQYEGGCARWVKSSVDRGTCPNRHLLIRAAERLLACMATMTNIISLNVPLLDGPTIAPPFLNCFA
jgi:hypothetical protein